MRFYFSKITHIYICLSFFVDVTYLAYFYVCNFDYKLYHFPQVNSVESALRYLAELEVITDYHNSSDSQISLVRRRSMIDRLPPYLIIQLKRFYNESKVKNVSENTSVNKFNSTTSQTSVIIRKHLKSVNIQSKLLIPKGRFETR